MITSQTRDLDSIVSFVVSFVFRMERPNTGSRVQDQRFSLHTLFNPFKEIYCSLLATGHQQKHTNVRNM